jgi:Protein of unknown function (DUF2795)
MGTFTMNRLLTLSRLPVRSEPVKSMRDGLEFPVTEVLIDRFLGHSAFPVEGGEIVETVRQNGAPEHLVRALSRLTPAKVFHNTFEVWFDAVHPLTARAA